MPKSYEERSVRIPTSLLDSLEEMSRYSSSSGVLQRGSVYLQTAIWYPVRGIDARFPTKINLPLNGAKRFTKSRYRPMT